MKKLILVVSLLALFGSLILVAFTYVSYVNDIDMCKPNDGNTTVISLNRMFRINNGNYVFHYTYTGHKVDVFYTFISKDKTFYVKYNLNCVGNSTRGTITIDNWKFKKKLPNGSML